MKESIELDDIERLSAPLMKYLRENFNPHCAIVVEDDRVRLVESVAQTFGLVPDPSVSMNLV